MSNMLDPDHRQGNGPHRRDVIDCHHHDPASEWKDHHTVPTIIYLEDSSSEFFTPPSKPSWTYSWTKHSNLVLCCVVCAAFQMVILVFVVGAYILWHHHDDEENGSDGLLLVDTDDDFMNLYNQSMMNSPTITLHDNIFNRTRQIVGVAPPSP